MELKLNGYPQRGQSLDRQHLFAGAFLMLQRSRISGRSSFVLKDQNEA